MDFLPQTLLELLMICDQSLAQEEMLLNVIAALTNLTFYSSQSLLSTSSSSSSSSNRAALRLERTLLTLSTHLSQSLFHENSEIVLETCRVLGNLTRRPNVIVNLIHHRIDEALLLLLLQHVQPTIVSAVAGVVVNFSSHAEGRQRLLQDANQVAGSSVYATGVVMALTSRLRKLTMRDVLIAVLLSQVRSFSLFVSQG
jgi:hypothetical protein